MTNGEKFKNEIIDEYQNLLKEKVVDGDGNRMNRAIKEIAYKYCGIRLVGASSTFKWLFEEYKEPPVKLTRLEYEILKWLIDKDYKYIARDSGGGLYVYYEQPPKKDRIWGSALGDHFSICDFRDLFHFVKWEDSTPTSIQEVLENCEVVEDAEE